MMLQTAFKRFAAAADTRFAVKAATANASVWCGSKRSFSDHQPHASGLRAFPSYSVVSEDCLFSLKLIPPKFHIYGGSNYGGNTLALDSKDKGRIMMEWLPRAPDGTVRRDKETLIRFALSAEEIGFLLDQLPHHPVEFARKSPRLPDAQISNVMETQDTEPMKMCRFTPGDGGLTQIYVDYELNGIGGQSPSQSEYSATGPMQINVQLGEFAVMRELMRTSIPVLVGWSTMSELALQRGVESQLSQQGYHQTQGSGGGGSNTPY